MGKTIGLGQVGIDMDGPCFFPVVNSLKLEDQGIVSYIFQGYRWSPISTSPNLFEE